MTSVWYARRYAPPWLRQTAVLLCAATVFAHSAAAFTTGSSGYSGEDDDDTCVECHTPGPQQPSAKLVGPQSILAGSRAMYQLVVDTDVMTAASTAKRWVGFDIATSAGNLQTVQQHNATRLLDGDISHTDAVPRTKILGITFLLDAPTTPGDITLYAAALSTDWTFTAANDTQALTQLPITVLPATATPDDLAVVAAVDAGADVDAMSGATSYLPTMTTKVTHVDEPHWGCASIDASTDAATLALVIAGLWLAAARRKLTAL